MSESLFEYMRREHDVLLLQTDESDIRELVAPRAYPCNPDDTATEAEIKFGIHLTGFSRDMVMSLHRDMKRYK